MKRKILTACLALVMAASAVSCGDGEDSSSKKSKKSQSDTSAVSQSEDSKTEDDSKDESKGEDSKDEPSDNSEDESKPEPKKDDKYAYYDLLDAEYQKYGKWSDRYNIVADGYVLIADNNGNNPYRLAVDAFKLPCLLIKEDGSYVDLRTLDIFKDYQGYIGEGLQYAGGHLYKVFANGGNDRFVKIDMDGKVVKDVDLGSYKSRRLDAVSGNGDAIISDGSKKYILKNGSDKLEEMPVLNLEGEHGLNIEATRIEFIHMFYKSKVYVWAYDPNGNEFMYYLDFNDLSWHKCEKLDEKNKSLHNHNSLYNLDITIGRYAFFNYSSMGSSGSSIVYDMETNTVTEDIPYVVSGTYYGGDFNIDNRGDKWVKIKLPSDAENFITDREVVEILAEQKLQQYTATASYMSNTHYLFVDSYGVFIRSFEKGKDDEKTVVLFEQK